MKAKQITYSEDVWEPCQGLGVAWVKYHTGGVMLVSRDVAVRGKGEVPSTFTPYHWFNFTHARWQEYLAVRQTAVDRIFVTSYCTDDETSRHGDRFAQAGYPTNAKAKAAADQWLRIRQWHAKAKVMR